MLEAIATSVKIGVGTDSEDTYDPYDHPNTDYPLGEFGAFLHITKYAIGTGILLLPYCFMKVGYAVGVPIVVIMSFIYIYVIHKLLHIEYALCKRDHKPNMSYVEVVEAAFKGWPNCRPVAVFLLYFNYIFVLITSNSGYLLVIGTNMKSLYDGIAGSTDSNVITFASIIMLPLILVCLIPKLEFLVPLSMFTNIFNAINIVLIPLGPAPAKNSTLLPAEPAQAYVGLGFIPQFCGIAITSLATTGLVFPVKSDMASPKRFGSMFGVFNLCLLVVTISYILFGLFGYLRYGGQTKDNILQNLPKKLVLSKCIFLMYLLAVCVSFVLQFCIVYDTIWRNYLEKWLKKADIKGRLKDLLILPALKIFINVLTFTIALAVPNLEMISALMGSFSIITEFCYPAVLHIVFITSTVDSFKAYHIVSELIKDFVIISLAVLLCALSLVQSISQIICFYRR